MKLSLLRHAKSSWKDFDILDHDRPLKERGVNDSIIMAREIHKIDHLPEHIFCSTSERTRETIDIMLREWGKDESMVSYSPELYHSGTETLMDFIHSIDGYSNIMVVGHNPGLHDFMEGLTGVFIDNFQTAAFVSMKFEVDSWKDINFGEGKLLDYIYPKMFK